MDSGFRTEVSSGSAVQGLKFKSFDVPEKFSLGFDGRKIRIFDPCIGLSPVNINPKLSDNIDIVHTVPIQYSP